MYQVSDIRLKQNKEGRFLNIILCYFENNILSKVINHKDINEYVQTLMLMNFFYLNKRLLDFSEQLDHFVYIQIKVFGQQYSFND